MSYLTLQFYCLDMFLEKKQLKVDSSNYADQVRKLRIVLIAAQKDYVLNAPLGDRTITGADAKVMNVCQARYDDYLIVQCAMLYGLEPGLQKCFERHRAYEMFQELKLVFQTHACVGRYETSDKYFAYKIEENSSASEHVLRMSGYYNCLNQVGVKLPDKIVIDRVLQPLSLSYQIFMMNYDMQGMELIPELFAMLKIAKGRNQEGASSVDG